MSDEKKTRKRASDKVRDYIPSCKEKSTLIAIADRADPDGTNCYPSIARIALDCGHSKRTVRSHIKTLEELGYLVKLPGGRGRRDTNEYVIPCCTYTIEEMEEITGVARDQLKLPLVQRDRGGHLPIGPVCILRNERREKDAELAVKGADSAPLGCESRTQPLPLPHQDHKIRVEQLKKLGIAMKPKKVVETYIEPTVTEPISEKTQDLIRGVLEKLQVQEDRPVGLGSRLRERLYGETKNEG